MPDLNYLELGKWRQSTCKDGEVCKVFPLSPAGVTGGAVQVAPVKSMLKAPVSKHLKRENEKLLSKFARNFNVRRYKPVIGAC